MADEYEQRPLFFPNPDEFESYDDVDSEVGQAEVDQVEKNYDENVASEDETGCCIV
jgi:hypothetical protein